MARPPPSVPPLSCSTGSSDPYCIVKVDNEPIIRYRPRPSRPAHSSCPAPQLPHLRACEICMEIARACSF